MAASKFSRAHQPVPVNKKLYEQLSLGEQELIIHSDRVALADMVFAENIPYKGQVVNELSAFWFRKTRKIIKNNLLSTRVADYPKPYNQYLERLSGRSMLLKKLELLPCTFLVSSYLVGPLWQEYERSGRLAGVKPATKLGYGQALPETLVVAYLGDENNQAQFLEEEELTGLLGEGLAQRLSQLALELHNWGASYILDCELILAASEFSFGLRDEELYLTGTPFSPDHSSYWLLTDFNREEPTASFYQEALLDYLAELKLEEKQPAPALPPDLVKVLSNAYLALYSKITGQDLLN